MIISKDLLEWLTKQFDAGASWSSTHNGEGCNIHFTDAELLVLCSMFREIRSLHKSGKIFCEIEENERIFRKKMFL